MNRKPVASLSLDLDNQWSYMKTHGNPDWKTLPSYLDVVVPRFLEMVDRLGYNMTVFIVGQDAALPQHHEVLRSITRAGHEVGNHSFHHEPWLHLYSEEQIEAELASTEDALEAATGARPIGFRGPGYSLSETVLRVLKRRGYYYDASTLPTFIGPLARAYYFMSAKLTPEERAQRMKLFGTLKDGLRPLKTYTWRVDEERLLEIPVTTLPLFRVPMHVSYVLYLAMYSRAAAMSYFRSALLACRMAGIEPSLLLHPLDFMGRGEVPCLDFFPAMKMPAADKLSIVEQCLSLLGRRFQVVSMRDHARHALASAHPRERALEVPGLAG
ncbi:MAG: polysaccharide deacetylase family protein [Acidobacteria bacterium]|nr:polysaccharide deacetylase family protein [Acidobacteriota bacterium]